MGQLSAAFKSSLSHLDSIIEAYDKKASGIDQIIAGLRAEIRKNRKNKRKALDLFRSLKFKEKELARIHGLKYADEVLKAKMEESFDVAVHKNIYQKTVKGLNAIISKVSIDEIDDMIVDMEDINLSINEVLNAMKEVQSKTTSSEFDDNGITDSSDNSIEAELERFLAEEDEQPLVSNSNSASNEPILLPPVPQDAPTLPPKNEKLAQLTS